MENNTEEELKGCELTMLRGECYLELAGTALSKTFSRWRKISKKSSTPEYKQENTHRGDAGWVCDWLCWGENTPSSLRGVFFPKFYIFEEQVHTHTKTSFSISSNFFTFLRNMFSHKNFSWLLSVLYPSADLCDWWYCCGEQMINNSDTY